MAAFVYTPAKLEIAKGDLDFDEAGDALWAMLVMSNTTADTEQDTKFVGSLVTLDEYGGANYVRKNLANQVTTEDDPNNRAEFSADTVTWSALGVGARQAIALVLYIDADNDGDPADDAANILVAYIDTGGFPFDGNGGDVTVTWNAQGILQVT